MVIKMQKKAQNQKYKFFSAVPKKAQEEIVGFALIIIIVAVILLVFLSISLRSPATEQVESYEVRNFIQASLQHTSDCRRTDNLDYFSVQRLIFECRDGKKCLDEKDACEVLNNTLNELVENSWKTGENRPIKGVELEILTESGEEVLYIQNGNFTSSSKGSSQDFYRGGEYLEIFFTVYY